MTRALLIPNPFAARADARAVTAILRILGRGGWNVDLRTTTGPGDARRIAEQARDEGFDVLVSHGGDGTAMQVAAGLAGTGIALGLIPGGTGNVLAGNLRLPRTTARAARALLTARPHPIDLGVVERADGPHYFPVAAGTGFDAQLMADTRLQSERRRTRVGKASQRIWWARGRTVRVEVAEGEPRRLVQLDGEVTGATPFEARLLPGALTVLVGSAFRATEARHG